MPTSADCRRVGLTDLLLAVAPRLTGVIWVIVGVSGFLVLLGGLVGVPTGLADLALLGHAPVVMPAQDVDWLSWLRGAPLLLIGVGAAAAAAILVRRCDLRLT